MLVLLALGCADVDRAEPAAPVDPGTEEPANPDTGARPRDTCETRPAAAAERQLTYDGARNLAFLNDGTLLVHGGLGTWIADPDGATIATVDPALVGPLVVRFAGLPDGTIATIEAGELAIVDLGAGTRTVRVPAGGVSGSLLAVEGDALWVRDGAGTLARVTADGAVTSSGVLAPAEAMALRFDGIDRLLAIDRHGVVSAWIVDGAALTPTAGADFRALTDAAGITAGWYIDIEVDGCGSLYALDLERREVWRLDAPGVGVQLARSLTISDHFAWELGRPNVSSGFPSGDLVVATDDGLVAVEAGAPR